MSREPPETPRAPLRTRSWTPWVRTSISFSIHLQVLLHLPHHFNIIIDLWNEKKMTLGLLTRAYYLKRIKWTPEKECLPLHHQIYIGLHNPRRYLLTHYLEVPLGVAPWAHTGLSGCLCWPCHRSGDKACDRRTWSCEHQRLWWLEV